jgi:hypothetical protein
MTHHSGVDWHGRTVVDRDGDRIGTLTGVRIDEVTGHPMWLLVTTGLFGIRSTFVPSAGAELVGDDKVRVPFDKDHVTDAPNVGADEDPRAAEADEIYRHYGMGYGHLDDPTGGAREKVRELELGAAVRRDRRPTEGADFR